jgi:hypothetical protein
MEHDGRRRYRVCRVAPAATQDVSVSRARRLRGRCHDELRRRTAESAPLPLVVPALLGAWSVIYLIGMLRAAAAAYGF